MNELLNLLYEAQVQAQAIQGQHPWLSTKEIGNIDALISYLSQAAQEAEHIDGNIKHKLP
jgi:hypothetical protein